MTSYTKEQKEENVRKWIQALESGRYKQISGSLRGQDDLDSNERCCLGVLCDVLGYKVGFDESNRVGYFLESSPHTKPLAVSFLPGEILELVGLRHSDGAYEIDDSVKYNSLVSLNDTGATFKDIARLISSRPKGLFKED